MVSERDIAELPQGRAEISFGDLFEIVRGAWRVLLAAALLGGGIAAAFAWTLAPVYRAQTLLSPAAGDSLGASTISRLAGQLAPLAGLNGPDSANGLDGRAVWLATLQSRLLAELFITKHNLLPTLFPDSWDAARGEWQVRDGKPGAPTMDEAFEVFRQDVLSVNEDRRTGLVTVTVESPERQLVAKWANAFVEQANELIRERAIAESQQSLEYLDRELKKTDVADLRRVIYGLVESKISQAMMANVRKQYAFAVIDPAVTPEPASFVRPRRVVMVGVGIVLGLLVGLAYACIRWVRRADSSPVSRS